MTPDFVLFDEMPYVLSNAGYPFSKPEVGYYCYYNVFYVAVVVVVLEMVVVVSHILFICLGGYEYIILHVVNSVCLKFGGTVDRQACAANLPEIKDHGRPELQVCEAQY